MISDRALDAALAEKVLTPDQLGRLRLIEAGLVREAGPAVDDERLRFVSGFADVFVTIGILLFVGALFVIMGATGSTPALAGIAASTWLLAEVFSLKRRMALPSIVLLVLFAASVFVLSLQVFTAWLPATHGLPARLFFLPTENAAALALAAIVTVALAAMHYVRFRVPVTVAAGALALCLVALGCVAAAVPNLSDAAVNAVLLLCGLGVFALAMRFDTSDPERVTRRTDIAFWLHLLAAPLIVHPLIAGILSGAGQDLYAGMLYTSAPGVSHAAARGLSIGSAVAILWVFVIFGLVALAIDRRAILVSGLLYAGLAFGTLVRTLGQTSYVVPTVLLALGALILLVSAGWHPLRRAILRRLPLALARRLPHPMLVTP